MYQHHLQKIEGQENYKWLRNMMYLICQQLMQQNSMYYLMYCFLCSDCHWQLMFYLYHTKYAASDDKTYFWHIDVNISSLLINNCGNNMIQKSVSLNEKNDSNCTEILLEMQCHLSAWWEWVKTREKRTDELVHNILKDLYTKEDKQEFKIEWIKVSCSAGKVQVMLSHILHGAQRSITDIWRMMLFWFVAVQNDHEQLETVKFNI